MKRLYLLRHAKSSRDDPSLADWERPLAPRGRRAAKALARHLARQEVRPALVLCSPARRARETLDRVAPSLGRPRVAVEDVLYGADAERLLERLRRVPDAVPSVLLVGHDPGLAELALLLAADGPERARLAERFPTGALATLAVRRLTWSGLRPGDAELLSFVRPRDLE